MDTLRAGRAYFPHIHYDIHYVRVAVVDACVALHADPISFLKIVYFFSAKITKTSYSDDLFSDDLSDLQFSTESDTEAASDAETSETLAEGDDLSMELETFSSEDVVDLSESSATE